MSVQKRSHQLSMCSTMTKTFSLTKSLGFIRLSLNVTSVLAIIYLSMEQEKQFPNSDNIQLSLDSIFAPQYCIKWRIRPRTWKTDWTSAVDNNKAAAKEYMDLSKVLFSSRTPIFSVVTVIWIHYRSCFPKQYQKS